MSEGGSDDYGHLGTSELEKELEETPHNIELGLSLLLKYSETGDPRVEGLRE